MERYNLRSAATASIYHTGNQTEGLEQPERRRLVMVATHLKDKTSNNLGKNWVILSPANITNAIIK